MTVTVTGSYDTTVTTSDDNSLNATVIDRDDFDVAYTTNTEFGTNAGADRNDDITIQEPTGGDDVMAATSQVAINHQQNRATKPLCHSPT